MRHSKKFNELLLQYEATPLLSGRKSEIFWRMMRAARTFSDWASIYQYADSSIRKDAQREMETKVLRGKSVFDIQLNILELFLIIDKSDKDEILRRYLKKHHEKDDLLFVLEMADSGESSHLAMDVTERLGKLYKRFGNIHRGLKARCRKSWAMLEKYSTFNP